MFVNDKETVMFKAADSKMVPYPLCLGNISKDFNSTNAQKTGLFEYIYDFSVDYRVEPLQLVRYMIFTLI